MQQGRHSPSLFAVSPKGVEVAPLPARAQNLHAQNPLSWLSLCECVVHHNAIEAFAKKQSKRQSVLSIVYCTRYTVS